MWSLQSFNEDYELASQTTYVACVYFMHEQHNHCIYSQSNKIVINIKKKYFLKKNCK